VREVRTGRVAEFDERRGLGELGLTLWQKAQLPIM